MKVVQYDPADKPVRLVTESTENGVRLVAVGETGARLANILEVTPDGLFRYEYVGRVLGLPTDEHGRLKLAHEDVAVVSQDEIAARADELADALAVIKYAFTDDLSYSDDDTLERALQSKLDSLDLQNVTVGHLRTLVKALEAK